MKPDLFDQHARLKSQYPGVILLLRVGDFYEAFDDDADTLARVLSLARTTRGQRRMAGFPHMQLDRFLCERRAKRPAPGRLKKLAPEVVCVL